MVNIQLKHKDINLVFGTDFHLSAIAPGRRADDYQGAILEKIQFMSDLAFKIHGVGLVGGDVFHHKKPKAAGNTMGLIESTARLFSGFPLGKVFGAIGNHDLSWDRMDSLPHQPLGILIAAGVYHNLVEQSVVFSNLDNSVKVLVEAFPYCHETELLPLMLNSGPKPADIDYRVGLVHGYGHPDAKNATFGSSGIPYDPIGYDVLADLDYDFLCWGHDHSRKETVTVGNVTHINFGSLARAAFNEDENDRVVSVGIMSFSKEGYRYKEKAVPIKPIDAIFVSTDRAMKKIASSKEVSELFSDMDTAVDGIETSDEAEVLKQLCPAEEKSVLDRALTLCELE
jgi:hypothetical protein